MNGEYVNYIVSSKYYRNLGTAGPLIKEIKKDVDEIILTLSDASGSLVDEMLSGLNSLKTQLEEYIKRVDNIRSDLKANAVLFDGVYSNWKSKVGTVLERGYMCDGCPFLEIPNGVPRDYRHPKAYKYTFLISDVSIDEKDNYIYVTYKTELEGYEIKNPSIFRSVGFVDILKAENRNKELDTSRIYKNKINFMNKNLTTIPSASTVLNKNNFL